jgi:type II secretory pathway component PulK
MKGAYQSCFRQRTGQRRGAVLAVALVCLLVVVTILSGMLRNAVRARRQLHAERDLRQTQLLLEAGLDRAAAALRRSPEYRGETWNIPAKEILGQGDGQVVIETVAADAAAGRQVRVSAEYPAGSEVSVRRSRTFTVQLERTQNEE